MNGKYLLVVTGPTAIGKTALAIQLNKLLKTSIISCDSRQVYKELNIGTAKPTPDEIAAGNIKLVGHVSVTDHYSAGTFCHEANEIIENDMLHNNVSILCGGTGLYITSVTEGLHDFPEIDINIIETLNKELQDGGIQSLLKELQAADPEYFSIADVQNPRRVIRALQVIRQSGKPYSFFTSKEKKSSPYPVIEIILELPREQLYEKINNRVDLMIQNGLQKEVEFLTNYKNLKALQTVGYAEIFNYLDGGFSLDECVAEIKRTPDDTPKDRLPGLPGIKPKSDFIRKILNQSLNMSGVKA